MAAKFGLPTVSYGIGVQNRYSAFLDDEDAIGLNSVVPNNLTKRSVDTAAKAKGSTSAGQKLTNPAKANSRVPSTNGSKQQDGHKGANVDAQKRVNGNKVDNKRQRPVQHQSDAVNNAQGSKQVNSKQLNSAQNGFTANKFVRNQSNGYNQNQTQAAGQPNKENFERSNQAARTPKNNNQRFVNRPRQFNQIDKKKYDGQMNGNSGSPSNMEDEKRRRQQKRATDLKHKDFEKKDIRRSGQNAVGQMGPGESNETGAAENDSSPKGPRRRAGSRTRDEQSRNFKGGQRGRGRRPDGEMNGDRRESNQARSGPRSDRPPRNRNGFGSGSRGSRGGPREEKNQERSKPIPNFSDKSDFPSLAS